MRSYALFLAIALPLCLWRLGSNDVVLMEGIVADGARSMDAGTSLFVPRLHGEIYAYKPPLAYWLALASFKTFGSQSEWTLRLPFALCGVGLGLVVLGSVGSSLGHRTGWLAALASMSSVLAIQKLRLAEFDMPLAAGVGAAVAMAVADLAAPTSRAWRWIAAYAFLACGFLAKGTPALIFFAPGLLVAAVLTGRTRRLLGGAHGRGLVVLAASTSAWAVGAWLTDGPAAFAQPIAEAADKGLTWTPAAFARTMTKPFVAFALFFPWTLPVLGLLRRSTWLDLAPRAGLVARAAAGFIVGGLLTFMAVPATETRYLLPLAAPVGMLAAVVLSGIRRRALPRWFFAGWTAAAGIGIAATASLALLGWPAMTLDPYDGALLIITGALTASVAWLAIRRSAWPAQTPLITLAVCLAAFHVLAIEPHRARSRSLRPVAAVFDRHLPAGTPIWSGPVSKGFHHSSLTFYLRRPIRTFDQEPPPDGAHALLFSDEQPGLVAAPFAYETLAALDARRARFALVQVTGTRRPAGPGAAKLSVATDPSLAGQ